MALTRVGLVGCGIISEAHVRAYEKHRDRARIVACFDINRERAEQRADQVGDARVAESVEEILSDSSIDAVEICTPHHLHEDLVVAAAKARKQILCQKPLSKTLASCRRMIDAARGANVTLFYGETNRTMRPVVEARRALDDGRIGTVIGAQATMAFWQGGQYLSTGWRYDPQITGGGQLLDSGIHAIDVILHLGGRVRSVACFTRRFREELGGEDTATTLFEFESGAIGQLFSSQACGIWFPGVQYAVFGTEGVLTIGGSMGAVALHRKDLPEQREVLLERHGWGDSFADMIGRYLDTVQHGSPNPSPGEVGLENLEVVMAAYQSARTGRAVAIDEVQDALELADGTPAPA